MRYKTIYTEDIFIQKPKEEIISEIETRNKDWHRNMYVKKTGVICRAEKNPIRNDRFAALYYKDTVCAGQLGNSSPICERYPIFVRIESVAGGTLIHLDFTRDVIHWVSNFVLPMMVIGLAVNLWSTSSQILADQIFKWIISGIAVFSIYTFTWTTSKRRQEEAWPGVDALKAELSKLK